MKPKTVIVLLVALVACVGYVVVRNTDLFKTVAPEKAGAKTVFDANVNGAVKVTLTARDAEKIVFEKASGKWRITSPVDVAASTYDVNRVARLLDGLKPKDSFAPEDPDAVGTQITGLDRPRWTLEVVDEDGNTFSLRIGRRRPLGARDETYVQVPGQDIVHVVVEDFAGALDRPLADFRDKTVLDLNTSDIVRVRVRGRKAFELEKANGDWSMVQPTVAAADANGVKAILDALARVEADEFVADKAPALDRYGLKGGDESLILRVWTRTGPPAPVTTQTTAPAPEPKEHALAFGLLSRDRKKVYARLLDSPSVFLLPASLLDSLQPEPATLRDMRVMPFDAGTITRIDIQAPTCKASLMKDPTGWMMAKPYAGGANGNAIEDLLKAIATLKAQRWASKTDALLANRGLSPPKGSIKIYRGQDKPLTLLLGSASSSGVMTFLMRAGAGEIAVAKTGHVEPMLAGPAAYWGTRLFTLPWKEKITRIRVTKPGTISSVFLDPAGEWKMTAPIKGDADPASVHKLIRSAQTLVAQKVVLLDAMIPNTYLNDKGLVTVELLTERAAPPPPPPPAPATGPATGPATKPTTKPAPKPITKTYFVQAVLKDGKTHAWLRGKEVAAIGEFSGALFENLTVELRGTQVWRIDPNDVTAIEIIAGDSKTDLKRDKDAWICPSDPDVKIDGEKVAKFIEDIRSLDAEKFHTHRAAADDGEKFAFKTPWLTLKLKLAKGNALSLVISNEGLDKTANRFARASGTQGVFLIAAGDLKKLSRKLKDFEQ